MSEIPIKIQGLAKAYRIWHSPGARLQGSLLSGLSALVPFTRPAIERRRRGLYRDFHALQHLDLEVRRGESVAIIGRNGSGKSTLLQMVAGTLPPTQGTVEINGRVAALLELGSGFNPEYTGRENVLLNATVLGLTPEKARERFSAIEEFAEIGEFIDQPVKTYSTGMAVRLAFAVLTQIEPEILIVDEALAVGDLLFQQKCFDVIRRLRARGCTFLFVSHSMGTVLELCDRAVLLDRGEVKFIGPADEAVRMYERIGVKALFERVDDTGAMLQQGAKEVALKEIDPISSSSPTSPPVTASSEVGSIVTEKASVEAVHFYDLSGRPTDVITSGQTVTLVMRVKLHVDAEDPHLGFKIRDNLGRVIYETSSYCLRKAIGKVTAGTVIEGRFELALPIADGEYSVVLGVANGGYGTHFYRELILYLQGAAVFQIVKDRRAVAWSGIVNLQPRFTCYLP